MNLANEFNNVIEQINGINETHIIEELEGFFYGEHVDFDAILDEISESHPEYYSLLSSLDASYDMYMKEIDTK